MAQSTQADKPAETIPQKVKKTKSKPKDVVENGMGGKLDTKDNTSKELGDGSTDFTPVTRDDQLRFKGSTKGSKSQNGSKSQKKVKKRGKGKGKKKAPTKVAVGRKRKVLKVTEENADETKAKKTRTSRSSSSKVAKTEEVAASVDQPAKTRKAKGQAAAAKSKATKAKPGPKAKAKAKASPKGKAAPKPKARGRSKKQPGDDFLERSKESALFEASMVKEMEDFAKSFDPKLDVKGDSFKAAARAHDPGFSWFRLNIYWSRCICGVTSLETGKDAATFSFNTSSACDVHKISIAVYCAIQAATLQMIAFFQR